MKYYIHDWYDNRFKYFDTWWDLISYIKEYIGEESIAHTEKDVYARRNFKFKRVLNEYVDYNSLIVTKAKKLLLNESIVNYPNHREVYCRPYIVYDQ